jgi:hypothetical protein
LAKCKEEDVVALSVSVLSAIQSGRNVVDGDDSDRSFRRDGGNEDVLVDIKLDIPRVLSRPAQKSEIVSNSPIRTDLLETP